MAFAPLRVDVIPVVPGADGQAAAEGGERTARLKVSAWETFRGNDWGNTGEAVAAGNGGQLDVKVLGAKQFYMERSKCESCFFCGFFSLSLGRISLSSTSCPCPCPCPYCCFFILSSLRDWRNVVYADDGLCDSQRYGYLPEPHDFAGYGQHGHRPWHAVPDGQQ